MARSTRKAPNSWGSIETLHSGKFRAFYRMDGRKFTAPHTFGTKADALAWLATERADRARGTWTDPDVGTVTLEAYATTWLETRADLAPRTREDYGRLLHTWLLPRIGGARGVELGSYALADITPTVVRTWYGIMLNELRTCETERRTCSAMPKPSRYTHRVNPARAWAMVNGMDVAPGGRVPTKVLAAWKRAGSPHVILPTSALPPLTSTPGAEADARVWALANGVEVSRSGRVGTKVLAAWCAAGSPIIERQAEAAPDLPHDIGKPRAARAYATLHAILNTAVDEGHIQANPCRLAGASTFRTIERGTASPEEVAALAEAMPRRYRAAVLLAAWSGLRYGELFALARKHIDLEHATVRVERSLLVLTGQRPSFGRPKTASSTRTVTLPGFVVDALREHMAEFTGKRADALIFTNAAGDIVRSNALRRYFKPAREMIGRPDLRWHDLRHTGATLAYRAGASVKDVQHRLGHSTVRAAMIYAHTSADADRQVAERLDSLYASVRPNVTPLHYARKTA